MHLERGQSLECLCLFRTELLVTACWPNTRSLQKRYVHWEAGEEDRQGENNQYKPASSREEERSAHASVYRVHVSASWFWLADVDSSSVRSLCDIPVLAPVCFCRFSLYARFPFSAYCCKSDLLLTIIAAFLLQPSTRHQLTLPRYGSGLGALTAAGGAECQLRLGSGSW